MCPHPAKEFNAKEKVFDILKWAAPSHTSYVVRMQYLSS